MAWFSKKRSYSKDAEQACTFFVFFGIFWRKKSFSTLSKNNFKKFFVFFSTLAQKFLLCCFDFFVCFSPLFSSIFRFFFALFWLFFRASLVPSTDCVDASWNRHANFFLWWEAFTFEEAYALETYMPLLETREQLLRQVLTIQQTSQLPQVIVGRACAPLVQFLTYSLSLCCYRQKRIEDLSLLCSQTDFDSTEICFKILLSFAKQKEDKNVLKLIFPTPCRAQNGPLAFQILIP